MLGICLFVLNLLLGSRIRRYRGMRTAISIPDPNILLTHMQVDSKDWILTIREIV